VQKPTAVGVEQWWTSPSCRFRCPTEQTGYGGFVAPERSYTLRRKELLQHHYRLTV